MRNIAVFSGSAHPELAEEICAHLDAPLHPVNIQRFANDCMEVQLQRGLPLIGDGLWKVRLDVPASAGVVVI
jgi:hypothetical protein